MTGIGVIFVELGIPQYLDVFLDQGFDTWETILDITESDFDTLGVKLGHRRKLQRRIADFRGLSAVQSLKPAVPLQLGKDASATDFAGGAVTRSDIPSAVTSTAKRKYRRHPKPDANAPERPPSAYVIFSNKTREDLKDRHLTFTEIAKLAGEKWQRLSAKEREPFETEAHAGKERYNAEMQEYKTTVEHKQYNEYLQDFRAGKPISSLKPKTSPGSGPDSNGDRSATGSQNGQEQSSELCPTVEQSDASWREPSVEYRPAATQNLSGPSTTRVLHDEPLQKSPSGNSSTSLPGYRDIVIHTAQQESSDHDSGAPFPSISYSVSRGASSAIIPAALSMNTNPPSSYADRRSNDHHIPPLLTSNSTGGASTESTASSDYYGPRTPLEPMMNRALPLPHPLALSKHDSRLSTARPSVSPRPPQSLAYNPHHHADYPQFQMAPVGYLPPMNIGNMYPSHKGFLAVSEEVLDPVSALLKAGEMVDRRDHIKFRGLT